MPHSRVCNDLIPFECNSSCYVLPVLFRAMNCLLIDWLRCFMASEGESNIKTMKILMKFRFYRVTPDIVQGSSKRINNL